MWRQNWSEVLRSVTLEKLSSCRNKTDSTRWKVRTCFQSYPLTSCLSVPIHAHTNVQEWHKYYLRSCFTSVHLVFFLDVFYLEGEVPYLQEPTSFVALLLLVCCLFCQSFFFFPKADNHVFLHNHSCSSGSRPWPGLQSLYRLDCPLPFLLPETLASTHGQDWQTLMAISALTWCLYNAILKWQAFSHKSKQAYTLGSWQTLIIARHSWSE